MYKVSVIIPTFNNSKTIKETIESVLNQDFKNLEIIIIDDGSTDNTEEIIKELKIDQLKYFKKENSGPSDTRNYGVKNASGEFIFFLDADDLIHKTYIQKCVDILNNDKSKEIIYSKASFFGSKTGEWKLKEFTILDFLKQNCIHISCLLRKKTFLKVGGFDTKLKILEDWDLWMRIIDGNENAIYRIPEKLFYYRKRNDKTSITSTLHKKEIFNESYLYVYSKNYKYYKKNKLDIIQLLNSEKINSKYKRKYFSIWYIKIFYKLLNKST